MIEIEIPDKGIIVEVPDNANLAQVQLDIENRFYAGEPIPPGVQPQQDQVPSSVPGMVEGIPADSPVLQPAVEEIPTEQSKPVPPKPQEIRRPIFDPEGKGYDNETLATFGRALSDNELDHEFSRVELPDEVNSQLGLPPGSGQMLKGRKHPTWGLAMKAEQDAGFLLVKHKNGKYYSIPAQPQPQPGASGGSTYEPVPTLKPDKTSVAGKVSPEAPTPFGITWGKPTATPQPTKPAAIDPLSGEFVGEPTSAQKVQRAIDGIGDAFEVMKEPWKHRVETRKAVDSVMQPYENMVDKMSEKTGWTVEKEKEEMLKNPDFAALRYALLKTVAFDMDYMVPGLTWAISPMDWEEWKARSTEEKTLEMIGSSAGLIVGTAGFKIGAKLLEQLLTKTPILKKVPWTEDILEVLKRQDWFRRVTNRERGLVVQSIAEMEAAGMSEAQILKTLRSRDYKAFQDYKAELIRQRGGGKAAPEPEPTSEPPVKPKIPPQEPSEPLGATQKKPIPKAGAKGERPQEAIKPLQTPPKQKPAELTPQEATYQVKRAGVPPQVPVTVGEKTNYGKNIALEYNKSHPGKHVSFDAFSEPGPGYEVYQFTMQPGGDIAKGQEGTFSVVNRLPSVKEIESKVSDFLEKSKSAAPKGKPQLKKKPAPAQIEAPKAPPSGKPLTKKQVMEQRTRLLAEIDEAIKRAPVKSEQPEMIKFKAGNTTFKFDNTKENLEKAREVISKYFPKTAIGPRKPFKPKKPSMPPPAAHKIEPKWERTFGFTDQPGWWSDGRIAIKGKPTTKAAKAYDKKGPKPSFDVIKDYLKKATHKAELKYYRSAHPGVGEAVSKNPIKPIVSDDRNPIPATAVFKTDNGIYQAVDQALFNVLRNAYPNATYKVGFHVKRGKKPEDGYVVAYDKGKPVGMVMGFTESAFKTPQTMAKQAGYASIGEFAFGKGKGGPPPSGYYADPDGFAANIRNVIDMPELVELAKQLMGGKYPRIKKWLGTPFIRGSFWFKGPKKGTIEIRRDLFQDIHQALATMAHEVGHLVDFLPDEYVRRGNILGHIAALKKFTKHLLPRIPGGKAELTEADRSKIRKEAEAFIKARDKDKYIDEVIRKEIGVDPDDILAIWRSVEDARLLNPDLYEFIARLSGPEKKAVVKAAMKGQTHESLKQFVKIIEEPTGNKIKVDLYETVDGKRVKTQYFRDEIKKKYAEMIEKEIEKLRAFKVEEMMDELKSLSVKWKPFDPAADEGFTRYRFSPEELYADAFSVLINAPGMLKSEAPKFWEAFFNYLEVRPGVEDAYNNIQELIARGPDAVSKARLARDYEMFRRGHELQNERFLERGKSIEKVIDSLGRWLWDEKHAVLKELRQLEKAGGKKAQHAFETRVMLEEILYLDSEVNDLMYDFVKNVQIPAEKAGLSKDDLGVYFMRKHIQMHRPDIASVKGYHPASVEQDLAYLEKAWGHEKFNKAEEIRQAYREIREKRVIPRIEEGGIATPELMKVIWERTFYQKMSVQHFLNKKYGANTTARFYKQVGSLEDIENPLVATMIQDMLLIRAAFINKVKSTLLVDLKEHGLVELAPLRFDKNTRSKQPLKPRDKDIALFTVLKNGKPTHRYVPAMIAKSFEFNPLQATKIATMWHWLSQPIREILVNKNPVWMARNPIRDFRETVKKVPEIKLRHMPRLAKEYKGVWGEVWREAMKGDRSPLIADMMQGRRLIADRVWAGRDTNFEDAIERTINSFALNHAADRESANAIKRVWRFLDNLGRASEIWSKVSGESYLRKYTDRSPAEISFLVRNRIGTPNVKNIAELHLLLNNLFLYSNVNKEGIRSHVSAFKENPGTYIWKTLYLNWLPKAVLFAGALGAFGKYWEDAIRRISEYDKAFYTCIPLYIWNGKTAYLRIPEDYEGQFFGALLWKILNTEFVGPKGAVRVLGGFNPYSWHPLIEVGARVGDYYLKGQNPVDPDRGEYVMSPDAYTVGGADAAKEMGRYAWKNLGGSVFYDPSHDDIKREKTWVEKMLRTFPGNVLGTFLKISDYGLSEELNKRLEDFRKLKAGIRVEENKALMRMSPEDKILLIAGGPSRLADKAMKILLKEKDNAWTRALASARSNDEIMIIVDFMLEDMEGRREQ